MRLCKFVLALGAIALLSAPVLAQGRGGFGRGGLAALAQNKSVQDELKIKDDEKTKVDDAIKKVREDLKDEYAKVGRNSTASDDEKAAARKKINEATTKAIKETLSADQFKRLQQINRQQEGIRVFTNEDVQSALKLTDDQKDKLKGIAETYQKDMQALRPTGGGQPSADDRAKMATLRKETMGKAKDALNADQKKTLDDLLGKPFEVKFEPRGGGAGGNRTPRKPRTDF
jgi:hypothetical protein